ncbi:hypothetical protein NGM99_04485 [Mesorhizobium sp. RP14(2022)]|uniref:Uncharacterized protein n=1 Tax=Mesorhizobium liriopis TaxID=2953882 RepID=A0ABT1C330_9HYPH|nr:hypothetical protein [Mesorhizobium liriopis]MCO6049048.1 hypothetical protein [Mesorhizobium liriopis]
MSKLRLEHPLSVAIIGNAPGLQHPVEQIDRADWVVRFNNAPGFGAWSGKRVTHLALVNHGGQMEEWLGDPGFIERPVVRQAQAIIFPFAPKTEPVESQGRDGRDWTHEARAKLAPLGVAVTVLPDALHREAKRLLATDARPDPVPSTGYLVTLSLLSQLPMDTTIDIHGFGFEGWDGHSWAEERRWFEAREAEGRLVVHPLVSVVKA